MKKTNSILLILFLCFAKLLPAQYISSLNPNSGNTGQSLTVLITGSNTHFTGGSSTVNVDFEFSQGSSTISNINVLNWTNLEADVNIPPFTTTGYYDLYCYNSFDGDLHTDRAFYVIGTPQQIAISPTGADPGQTLTITITGTNTHFSQGSATYAYIDLDFSQGSSTMLVSGNVSVANDTLMAAQFTIPAVVTPAYYSLHVSAGQGEMIAPNSLAIPSTIGINENSNNEISLSAFPNPYVDQVVLTAELKKFSPVEIKIFSSTGKKVFEKSFDNISPGKFSYELNAKTCGLADDVYFVQCKAGSSSSVIKLIRLN